MICVQTNDAWYDPRYAINQGGFWGSLFRLPILQELAASGPNQHFAHSIFRAVETRLPVVRSANSGVSAIISPNGEIEKQIPYGMSGRLVAEIPIRKPSASFYTRYGDWFAQLCLAALALAAAAQWIAWIKWGRHLASHVAGSDRQDAAPLVG